MEYLSTTALANELELAPSELFTKFKNLGWIDRKDNKWILTELGAQNGGKVKNDSNYGEYVIWPETIKIESPGSAKSKRLLNSTALGQHFQVSPQKINLILFELGFVVRDSQGWEPTKLGQSVGGKHFVDDYNRSYVLWPETVLKNGGLKSAFDVGVVVASQENTSKESPSNFRDKYPANIRTADGHRVRSLSEAMIDDWLYYHGIVHCYEKKLPIEENAISDFYIPAINGRPQSVYIEFWGINNDQKYNERRAEKVSLYKKHGLNLLEFVEADIQSLDDVFPVKLRPFKIEFK